MHGRLTGRTPYAERVRSARLVYLNGALVGDVGAAPAFAGAIEAVEGYYALQAERPEIHLARRADGAAIPTSLLVPETAADLAKKRASYKEIADLSFGMLGRTPDFINAAVMALGAHSEVLSSDRHASYEDNARNYYDHVCANNLFIGHGAINPQIDRSVSMGGSGHSHAGVKVVGHDSAGITVSGAKMILTLAPLADELLIFNMPGLQPGDEDFALAFAIPVSAPGLKLICRKSFYKPEYSTFDHPLANRFDEIDSYMILEDAFVPWERVFVFRDVARSNAFYDKTYARNHAGHQGIVRGLAKAELAAGVAVRLAEDLGLAGAPAVQEQLGEIASCLELVKALIARSETEATRSEAGVLTPNIVAIQSMRWNFPRMYQRILEIIRSLAPGSMLAAPIDADFAGENGALLTMALTSAKLPARERIQLLNLAWDLVGDAFGQRQLTYEYYHAGEPGRISAGQYKNYDWRQERLSVARSLEP